MLSRVNLPRQRNGHGTLLLLAIELLAACDMGESSSPVAVSAQTASDFATARVCKSPPDAPVRIAGGSFVMGSDALYAEEGPERQTRVDAFWIDPHEVTNRQFAEFVRQTGYITVAEQPVDPAQFGVPVEDIPAFMLEPGSAVFTPPDRPSNNYADWWTYVPGANWKRPYGPQGPGAQPDQPVVHLAWADMQAYATWKGGAFPQKPNGNMPPAQALPNIQRSPTRNRPIAGRGYSL